MKPVSITLEHNSQKSLYIQLYEYLKKEISCGQIAAGEKLPSLRRISGQLGISVTTSQMAYNQLLVEGYITSSPQSGYYAADVGGSTDESAAVPEFTSFEDYPFDEPSYKYDLESFDFVKWKKCVSRVLNEYPGLLLSEGDRQGERILRAEISRYVYRSRGVDCSPEQVVISAGTQQLTNHLARILRHMKINIVSTEDPGYTPVRNIFRDRGFTINSIPIARDGISIESLPRNIASAVYVMPSNQFPTGAVMPVGRRYELLKWAEDNDSVIIEDDYDSELRYFGRPVPALQSLDRRSRVVYLGSFSSTLFAAIRLSYMILPPDMMRIYRSEIMDNYDQTSSKTEQLTLAMFMENGYYSTTIRKLRKLYSRKLQRALEAFDEYGRDFITPLNKNSGITISLSIRTDKDPAALCADAAALHLHVISPARLNRPGLAYLLFYYNQVPLEEMEESVAALIRAWAR